MPPRSRLTALAALGIFAAAAGLFIATRTLPESVSGRTATALADGETRAASGTEVDLESVQAGLSNALVLPADYRSVPPFELQGSDGRPLDQTFLEGRWTLAFFGYTHCPDVCPVTLSVMREVVAQLEERGVEPMQVAFFTVDPSRDTAERLQEYVAFFDENFIGVTGELANVFALTRELGIVAAYTANDADPDNYFVDHTASMLLIDPARRVRAKFNAPHELGSIIDDYLALMAALEREPS